MKKIILVLIVLVLIIIAAAAAKDNIAKAILIKAVKGAVGLDVNAQEVKPGFFKTDVDISNLYIYNPLDFTDRLMADVPRLYIDYDLGSLIIGKPHIKVLHLKLKEFVVVRNTNGRLNLNYVSGLSQKSAGSKKPAPQRRKMEVKIDILRLEAGRVLYKDYTQIPVSVIEYRVNIDETYENITDVEKLVKLIITRSLVNTAISRLGDLDFTKLKTDISDIIKGGKDIFRGVGNASVGNIAGAIQEAAKELGNIFKRPPEK